MKGLFVILAAILACAMAHTRRNTQSQVTTWFDAVCGGLSRGDCIKRIRACRRLNNAMSEEVGSAEDILDCTAASNVDFTAIIEAWSKFNNGEGDAPTLASFGVDEAIMKEVRKCVLTARGLMDAEGNLDKAAMEANVDATLRRILGPNQPELFNAMKNAKEVCGKPTLDQMKEHRNCMNKLCVDNINA